MNKDSKILVLGNGLVGSSILRQLTRNGYTNIITKTHNELDLTDELSVKYFFKNNNPEYVFLCAAKVGGIYANNTYPVEFFMENMAIEMNVLKYAAQCNVRKLLFLGSSCIYPKECLQPIKEEYLLNGYLESSNEMYALAKISGIKLCQAYNKQYNKNFIVAMPCSLYGENDSFHQLNSHFIPAIMQRMDIAKDNKDNEIVVWGDGTPLREFMYIDDFAEIAVFLMNNYNSSEVINIGTGIEYSIKEIIEMIKEVVGFEGNIVYDSTNPNGTMRKVLNIDKMKKLGLKAKTELQDGLKKMYGWYCMSNKRSENIG